MASASRLFVLSLVMLLLVQIYVEAESEPGTLTADLHKKGDGKGIDCKAACTVRCQKASGHKICLRTCHTCCEKCKCVPVSTSGNEDVCTCYANMRTHHNGHKCP